MPVSEANRAERVIRPVSKNSLIAGPITGRAYIHAAHAGFDFAKAKAATIQNIAVGQMGKTSPIAPITNAIQPKMRQAHMRSFLPVRRCLCKLEIISIKGNKAKNIQISSN